MIIVSHDTSYIKQHCKRICVLSNGRMSSYSDVDEAVASYTA